VSENAAPRRVDEASLRRLCTAIQVGFGVPEADARTVSDVLVEANLVGLDTHGVIRLPFYMNRVKAGGNNPTPHMKVVRDHACTALLDADNALGPVGGVGAMNLAIDKASESGVGIVLIRNCNHYGPAGHYARMAVARDMIGISLTNVLASMPPTNGAARRVGNNPYAIAFPAGDEPPVVVDGATSLSSWGKLFLCAQNGTDLPEGCYVDGQGKPTVNPQAVLDGGALLPFAGHKGYGIAVAIELLTGMLAGGALDRDIPHPYKQLASPGANSFFMGAFRVDHFMDPGEFKRNMDQWIVYMRETPKAPGADRVWLPGEKEAVARRERLAAGIPLGDKMIAELQTLAAEVNVAFTL